jgi:hypothetical protein
VLPEPEAELYDKVNYPNVPRIVQLLEERSGRKTEQERT